MGKTKIDSIETDETDYVGGSLAGYISASYKDLVALFGPPNSEGDGYKVSTEWRLVFKGHHFRLYDYKDTELYDRSQPSVEEFRSFDSYEWHVGAENEGWGKPVPTWVRQMEQAVIRAIAELHKPGDEEN